MSIYSLNTYWVFIWHRCIVGMNVIRNIVYDSIPFSWRRTWWKVSTWFLQKYFIHKKLYIINFIEVNTIYNNMYIIFLQFFLSFIVNLVTWNLLKSCENQMLFWPNRINLIHIVYYSWNLKYFCTIRKNWNDLLNSLSYLCTLFLSCFSSGIKGSKCISKRLNKLTWSCRKWSLYYIISYWYYIMSDFDTNLKRVIQQVRKMI